MYEERNKTINFLTHNFIGSQPIGFSIRRKQSAFLKSEVTTIIKKVNIGGQNDFSEISWRAHDSG
jgi:hypothetical protein